jgi:hypothetical protein
MKVEPFYECPYCPRDGTGVIAADLHRLAQVGTPGSPLNGEMDETPGEASGVLVFNPDGVPNRPCRHLVSFVADPQVNSRRGRNVFCHTVSWDHPWFAANDPDQSLEVYLWTEVFGGGRDACYPVTPFDVRQVAAHGIDPATRRRLSVPGTVIAALDPDRFFAELAAGYDRLQEVEEA